MSKQIPSALMIIGAINHEHAVSGWCRSIRTIMSPKTDIRALGLGVVHDVKSPKKFSGINHSEQITSALQIRQPTTSALAPCFFFCWPLQILVLSTWAPIWMMHLEIVVTWILSSDVFFFVVSRLLTYRTGPKRLGANNPRLFAQSS